VLGYFSLTLFITLDGSIKLVIYVYSLFTKAVRSRAISPAKLNRAAGLLIAKLVAVK